MKNEMRILILITFVSVILRLIALPYIQIVDADATSRIFIAEDLLANFHFIYEGVWLPLHHYFNALAIYLSGEHLIGPSVLHILFASFISFPLFFFLKREFGQKAAFFAVILFLLSSVVVRNSFFALSGIPHAFFIACSLNFLSKTFKTKKIKHAIIAGLFITIAAGFRYEAWVLIAGFTGLLFLTKKVKLVFAFWLPAMLFPVFWMIGNYITHDHILYGVTGVYNTLAVENANFGITTVETIKRVLFFPFSWFISYSPLLFLTLLYLIKKRVKNQSLFRFKMIWLLPLLFLLVLFIYKSIAGTLLMQHRFTIILLLLSTPISAFIYNNINWTKFNKVYFSFIFITLLPLSYFWLMFPFEKVFLFSNSLSQAVHEMRIVSIYDTDPIPRLKDEGFKEINSLIKSQLKESDGLIIDFLDWEKTYYLALESELNQSSIFIVKNEQMDATSLNQFLNNKPTGIILISCFSQLSDISEVEGNTISFAGEGHYLVELIDNRESIYLFKYQKLDKENEEFTGEDLVICPEINSIAYYKHQIKTNFFWFHYVKQKAAKYQRSVEEELALEAQSKVDKIIDFNH